jgi:GNAT superfamily N-acetyltransferase
VPRGPFVIDLFVLPASRRRGTGRALVQAALAAVPGTVALRVDDTAAEARALYAGLGFRPVP